MTRTDMLIALWVVFLWSLNLILQKFAVGEISIFVLSFLRAALILPMLCIFFSPQKPIWQYTLISLFLTVLYLILFTFGLRTTIGAGVSAFVIQMQVFFVVLCSFLILKEKPAWTEILGFLVSFFGLYFLSLSSSPTEFPLEGVALLIGSCITFGIGIALSKKYKIGQTMNDVVWLSTTASVPLFLSCLLFEGPSETFHIIFNMSFPVFLCIAFASFASTFWATYLWFTLLQKAPVSSVTSFTLLLPIFSNILSFIFFGELLDTIQIMACFIIISGVMVTQGLHLRLPLLFNWIKERVIL